MTMNIFSVVFIELYVKQEGDGCIVNASIPLFMSNIRSPFVHYVADDDLSIFFL